MTCKKHPRYEAKRKPGRLGTLNIRCNRCWAMWLSSPLSPVPMRHKMKTAVPNMQALVDAEKQWPENSFVKSVRAHYEHRGFISKKQAECLKTAGGGPRPSIDNPTDYPDDYDDDDGLNMGDFC